MNHLAIQDRAACGRQEVIARLAKPTDGASVHEAAIEIKRHELNSALIGRYWTKARALLETLTRLTAPKRGGFFDGHKFTALDLMREDPPLPRKWVGSIIDESGRPSIGMLPEGEVGLLAGSAGGGKSTLVEGILALAAVLLFGKLIAWVPIGALAGILLGREEARRGRTRRASNPR